MNLNGGISGEGGILELFGAVVVLFYDLPLATLYVVERDRLLGGSSTWNDLVRLGIR